MSVEPEHPRVNESWHVEGYAQTLRAADRSPATQRAYVGDLHQFIAWCDQRHAAAPQSVSKRVLREYLAFMTARGDGRASIARRRASLRSYCS